MSDWSYTAAIPILETPEYTLADLRRVAESCVEAMKAYRRRGRRYFGRESWGPVEDALAAALTQPAEKASRTMLAAVERLASLLEREAESGDCFFDTGYAEVALDACLCARQAMKHGRW